MLRLITMCSGAMFFHPHYSHLRIGSMLFRSCLSARPCVSALYQDGRKFSMVSSSVCQFITNCIDSHFTRGDGAPMKLFTQPASVQQLDLCIAFTVYACTQRVDLHITYIDILPDETRQSKHMQAPASRPRGQREAAPQAILIPISKSTPVIEHEASPV